MSIFPLSHPTFPCWSKHSTRTTKPVSTPSWRTLSTGNWKRWTESTANKVRKQRIVYVRRTVNNQNLTKLKWEIIQFPYIKFHFKYNFASLDSQQSSSKIKKRSTIALHNSVGKLKASKVTWVMSHDCERRMRVKKMVKKAKFKKFMTDGFAFQT